MRTTLNIDDPVLRELHRLRKQRGVTLGRLVNQLLLEALKERPDKPTRPSLGWKPTPMGKPLIDLGDKDTLWDTLDEA